MASELAKGRKKSGSKRAVVGAMLVAGVLGSLSMSQAAFAANGGSIAMCAEDNTGTMMGTSGTPTSMSNCAGSAYDWGLFSDSNPSGSAGGVNQTSLTGNKDGTMSIYAVNGVKMLSTMDMGNYKITGLANGTAATDAATFGQLTNATKYFVANSTLPNSIAYATDAVAIGGGAQSGTVGNPSFSGGVAIGVNANGGGGHAVVIGSGATTGLAPGVGSLLANTNDLVAIGDNAAAYYGHSIAMGGNAVVNPVSNGSTGFGYAIGIGDSVSVTQVGGTALGATAQVTGQYATALGFASNASATNGVAVGNASNASGASGVAVGNAAHATGAADVAIGMGAVGGFGNTNPLNSSVAIGYNAAATGALSTAVGNQATANSNFSSSLGYAANSSAIGAQSLGSFAAASGSYALAAGYNANASAGNSVALGAGSTTTATLTNAAYNPGSATLSGTASVANGEVSIGKSGSERRLTNLAAGSAPTDAVNVSQLQAEDATVDLLGANTAAALGGGSTYNATTGAITAPSYALANANTIVGTSGAATDVGTGFSKVDTALGKLNTSITNINNGGGIKYFHANSGSPDSQATASGSIAIGGGAQASGTNSMAMGSNASATNSNSVAFGAGSQSNGLWSFALGYNTNASAQNSYAIGQAATAASSDAMALGTQASVDSNSNAAVAMGRLASAKNAANGMAFGNQSAVTANSGVALGYNANASAANSVALGAGSTTTADLTQAGYNPGSAALSGTASTANGEVSIGKSGSERRLTNLAAGSAPTDAVNVSQLQAEDATVDLQGANTAAALGGGSTYNATTGAITAPSYTLANANSIGGTSGAATDVGTGFSKVDTALGKLNSVTTYTNRYFKVAGGANDGTDDAKAQSPGGVSIGRNAYTVYSNTIAIGDGARADYTDNMAVGAGAYGGGGASIAVGTRASTLSAAGANYQTALGVDAKSEAAYATALGGSADAKANYSVALGEGAVADRASGIGGSTKGAVSVGSGGAGTATDTRQIISVARGTQDTDAVNVSQLKGVSMALGTTVNADGTISAPSYTLANANSIGGTSGAATDVGSGFAKVDGALGKMNTSIAGNTTSISNITNQINNGTVGLVQQSAASANLTVGKATDGAAVDFIGTSGTRKLIGVTDGTVASGSKEAVNGGQLYTTNQAVAQNTTDIAGNTTSINTLNTNVSQNTSDIAGNTTSINNLDGRVTQNTTDIAGNTTSISNLQNTVNNINNGTVGLVQQSAAGANLTVGKDTDGAAVDFADKNGNTRTLKNVTAGVASTDAVNMSQLNATNANVTQNSADIAGNTASINTLNTNVAQNTSDIAGNTTAIAGNTTSINNLQNTVNNISSGTMGLVQQASAGADLTVGRDTDGTAVDFADKNGNTRTLKNVTAGVANTDAVNMSQLNATNANVAQNTSDIAGNTTAISNLDNRVTTNEGDISTLNTNVSNIDARVTKNTSDIAGNTSSINSITNQINNGTVGLVQQAAAGADLTVGKNTDGTAVDFADKNGNARTLKNVTAGVANTDAVNMSQLNATNANVAQNTSDITGNTTAISNLDNRVTTNEGDISTLNTNVSNIDARVTKNTSDIAGNTTSINNISNQINSGTIGLVQQSAAGANLTVGKDTDGAAVDFAGTVGARKLVNVADGAVADGSKEAVNGGQLHGVSQSVANAMGGGSTVNSDGSISAPSYTVTNVDGSTSTVNSVGDAITNIDGRTYSNTTAISDLSQTVNNITNNGAGIKYFHTNSTQADSVASGANAVAVGGNAQASASNAVAVGSGAQATQANSVALGAGSTTSAVTATTGATIAGSSYTYAGGAPTGTVSVGSAGSERTVTNVAAGQVSATSTDAVNGSQLYATNQAVNQLDGRMGNVENNLGNVTSTVNNITHTMASGQSGMFQVSADSNSTQPVASGTRSTAGGNGAVASGGSSTAVGNGAQATGSNSVAVGADSVASRDNTVSVGSAGKERQVTNVAAGTADTDAVNVSQLKSTGVLNKDGSANQTVTYDHNTDGSTSVTLNSGGDPTIIHNVAAGQMPADAATVGQVNDAMQQTANWAKNYTDQQVANVSRQARAGSASAIAVASLPQAYQPGQNSVGVAFGTYQGQNAMSVGMSAISESGRYIVKFSATGSQHSGAGAGIGAGMVW
ncbi:YadA-like family protein [Dyella kyungheensis]|uniref:YadA-like family protein n=1 Tax=Dyella kyungheensis TaxID=1242174 RepID=UPI003CEED9FB